MSSSCVPARLGDSRDRISGPSELIATNQFMQEDGEGLSELELASAFALLGGAHDRNLIGVRSPNRCKDSKGWDNTARETHATLGPTNGRAHSVAPRVRTLYSPSAQALLEQNRAPTIVGATKG